MKTLDDISLSDILPDSISGDETVKAAAGAIDPQLLAVSAALDLPLIYFRIDELTADQLEHLAVQYDVNAWRGNWPIETKRAVLKTAIQDKRRRGTRGAVQRAIETIAPIASIVEWWQLNPQGTPHTFSIQVTQDGGAVDPQTMADVYSQVNSAKPIRSHFDFTVVQLAGAEMYFSGFARGLAYARVRSAGTTFEQTEANAGIAGTARGVSSRWIIGDGHLGDLPEPNI